MLLDVHCVLVWLSLGECVCDCACSSVLRLLQTCSLYHIAYCGCGFFGGLVVGFGGELDELLQGCSRFYFWV